MILAVTAFIGDIPPSLRRSEGRSAKVSKCFGSRLFPKDSIPEVISQ